MTEKLKNNDLKKTKNKQFPKKFDSLQVALKRYILEIKQNFE